MDLNFDKIFNYILAKKECEGTKDNPSRMRWCGPYPK